MNKCRWCEDRLERGQEFCDDLCRRLHSDYWSAGKPANQYFDQDRAKREIMSKGRKTRYG